MAVNALQAKQEWWRGMVSRVQVLTHPFVRYGWIVSFVAGVVCRRANLSKSVAAFADCASAPQPRLTALGAVEASGIYEHPALP